MARARKAKRSAAMDKGAKGRGTRGKTRKSGRSTRAAARSSRRTSRKRSRTSRRRSGIMSWFS